MVFLGDYSPRDWRDSTARRHLFQQRKVLSYFNLEMLLILPEYNRTACQHVANGLKTYYPLEETI